MKDIKTYLEKEIEKLEKSIEKLEEFLGEKITTRNELMKMYSSIEK